MKKRRVAFCCILAIVVFFIGFGIWSHSIEKSEKVEEEEEEYIEECIRDGDLKRWVEWGIAEKGDHFYTINRMEHDSYMIPSLYLVEFHYQIRFRYPDGEEKESEELIRMMRSEIDYFEIALYSIKTGEKIKTIDVNKILQRDCPELQLSSELFIMRSYQDSPCMMLLLKEPPNTLEDGKKDTLKQAYLNVETEELSIIDSSKAQWSREWNAEPSQMWRAYIFNDTPHSLLEMNGIENGRVAILNYWEKAWGFRLPVTSLPEENEDLYTMFPDLKEKVKKYKSHKWDDENDIVYVYIYLMNDPTQEEIMRYMLSDGQEISFEGVTISKYKSIDGEEHEVHSFEEYKQYLKASRELLDESLICPIFRNEP